MKRYAINEIFDTIQGEGANAGRLATFVRFAGCNLKCSGDWSDGVYQPVCDTEFTGVSLMMTAKQLVNEVGSRDPELVVLTGGEPALQVDQDLVEGLHAVMREVAIETNGTKALPVDIDHVAVSPKTADHTIVVRKCHELRYVIEAGRPVPKTTIEAGRYYLSPAWEPDGTLKRETLEWTIQQIRYDQRWSLSVQAHKLLSLR